MKRRKFLKRASLTGIGVAVGSSIFANRPSNKLNEFKDLKRIRYTTSHPKDVTKDLIDAHQTCEKLMPVLHLPVQSGSSKLLESMKIYSVVDIIGKYNLMKQTMMV